MEEIAFVFAIVEILTLQPINALQRKLLSRVRSLRNFIGRVAFALLKFEVCVTGCALIALMVFLAGVAFSVRDYDLQTLVIERGFGWASLLGAVIGCVVTYRVCRRSTLRIES